MMESEISDRETGHDTENLERYKKQLEAEGFLVDFKLGYGNPKKSIPQIVKSHKADLLVMGAHGHGAVKDIIFGTTVDSVRHSVNIPVLIVRD